MGIPEECAESPAEFCQRNQLPFSDLFLLGRGLTHRSYLNEHPEALEDNERLEFLGDAVLDFVVAAWLYRHYPEMPEGDLTRMRSALVHTEQLADFARQIDLGRAVRLGRGEVQAGGRDRATVLCDTFEAVIGALFLDRGIDVVESFIAGFCEKEIEAVLEEHKDEDPKGKLQEYAQGLGYPAPQYVVIAEKGPDHSKVFEVSVVVNNRTAGIGLGRSKQLAEKSAAQAALVELSLSD